jgi:putative glutamine amidotransferase
MPSARPVLGFTCCRRSVGAENAQAVMERYLHGVSPHVDAIPMLVPSLPQLMDAEEVMRRLDGILLTGSPSNLQPARYGDPAPDAEGPFDPDRDVMAAALVDAALAQGKPVFGICRGFQELNVHFGGTLARDMATPGRAIQHHSAEGVAFDAMFAHAHPVDIQPGGLLEGLYGARQLTVNSVHYQGAAKLGAGLRVEAVAPDGVVEAFSRLDGSAPVLAVQWHPEWQPQANADSRALFSLMGRMLRGG